MTDTCRMCAAILTPPDTGRPPAYCSTACRRAAEYAIKRADRRIERLSNRLDALDVEACMVEPGHYRYEVFQRQRIVLTNAITTAEDRLHSLLGDR
jgi:hypothetical protein